MYNIRGSDVPCNPVTVAYAVVTQAGASLFIDEAKVSGETVKHLTQVGPTPSYPVLHLTQVHPVILYHVLHRHSIVYFYIQS